MDDFITKPLKKEKLFGIIEKWIVSNFKIGETKAPDNVLHSVLSDEQSEPVNLKEMMEIWGDEDLIKESFKDFMNNLEQLLSDIDKAIKNNDHDLKKAAHKFKGALLYTGAQKASDIAASIEVMGKNKKMNHAKEAFRELVLECEKVKKFIVQYMDTRNSANK